MTQIVRPVNSEQIQDTAAALFSAGSHTGVTFTYDDAGNRINATVTGGGGGGITDDGTAPRVVAYSAAAQARPTWRGPVIWQGDVTAIGLPTNMVPGKDWTQDFGARTDGARYFDGVTPDYAYVADSSTLRSPTSAITLAGFWRPHVNTTQDGGIWGKTGNNIGRSMSYGFCRRDTTDARNVRFRLGLTTAGNVLIDPSNLTTALAMDTWFFVACTWSSGAALRMRIWTTGGTLLSDTTGSTTYSDSVAYGADEFRIGRNDVDSYARFSTAAVGVHNAVLSDANLTSWRTNKVPPVTLSGGFWALNGASTSVESDTTQTNHLTLSGIVHTTGGP